jgi:hypothetical protein
VTTAVRGRRPRIRAVTWKEAEPTSIYQRPSAWWCPYTPPLSSAPLEKARHGALRMRTVNIGRLAVSGFGPGGRRRMRHATVAVPYVLSMVAVVVVVDLVFFRTRTWTWERLAVNVGIVLVFGAFYFRFFRT